MSTATVVYTTARTRFTISLRVFSVDTLNIYYSTNTTSPAPSDVLTGASLVDPNDYEIEGVNAKANTVTLVWAEAPATGTIIAELIRNPTRVSSFPTNRLPSAKDLDDELDHLVTLATDQDATLTDHESRIDDLEATDLILDGRLDTLETAGEDGHALLYGTGTGTFEAESKRISSVANPTDTQDAATKAYVDSKVSASGAVPGVDLADVGKALVATDDDPDTYAWGNVNADAVGFDNSNTPLLTAETIQEAIEQIRLDWVGRAALVGSGLSVTNSTIPAMAALTKNMIALTDSEFDELRAYTWNGTAWALTGSGLAIASEATPALARLSNSTVAFINSFTDELRTYSFNGSTWSLVGSGLSVGVVYPAITALSSTRVALFDQTAATIQAYDFNGSTWAAVGSAFSISAPGSPAIAALNSTDIAFFDNTNLELRCYRFNGSSWSLVGNALTFASAGTPALCALNNSDVVFYDATNEGLRIYRFDGSDWEAQGPGSITISGGGTAALAAINQTDVVFFDSALEEIRTYRFPFGIGLAPFGLRV